MRKFIKFLLLTAFMASAACTNDETDEGVELLNPNEPVETARVAGADTLQQSS